MPIGSLIQAATHGNIEKVKRLLSIANIRCRADEWDNSALRRAAENGHIEVVELLLSLKVVRSHANAANNDALYLASRNGHVAIVKKLLEIDVVSGTAHQLDNYILRRTALIGHAEVVKALLNTEEIRKKSDALNNSALCYAAEKGHIEVVQALLDVDIVYNQAHIRNNESLRYAAENGHLAIVQLLLAIDEVRHQADIWCNAPLRRAAENGHFEVVKLLLDIDIVRNQANEISNYALRHAAREGHLEIVRLLLNINVVQDDVHVNNNEALRWAAQNGHIEVVKQLLLVKSTIASLNEITIFDIFSQAITRNFELANLLMHALGRPSLAAFSERTQEETFRLISTHLARTTVENNPYGVAKSILEAHQRYLTIKQEEAENFGGLDGNRESSMDDDLLKQANTIFTEKIQPTLQNKFEALGNDFESCVEAVELKIRKFILKKIKQTAEMDNDKAIIQFIQYNTDNIIHDTSLMAEARQLFSSKTIASHIAWRCYDKEAENTGWDNLFVPPKAEGRNTSIFTTHAAWDGSLTLQEASDIVRKRTAYYYLLVEAEPNQVLQEAMEEDFVLYLAEIRRAHSLDSTEIDNPSCFPGTLTRLACIGSKSSLFKYVVEKQAILESLLIEEIEKAFKRILGEEKIRKTFSRLFPDADSPQTLCAEISDAITGINYDNARNIIVDEAKTTLGYSISVFTPAHAKARAMFLNSIISKDDFQETFNQLVIKIEKTLQQTNPEWFITPVDRAYIQFFWASLSPPSVASRLASLYSRAFSETEISYKNGILNRFEIKIAFLKKQFLLNPERYNNARLANQYKKLEEQEMLFEKLKETELNKSYSTEELVEAVEELTAIPYDLRLPALNLLQARLKPETQLLPGFFSSGNKRQTNSDSNEIVTIKIEKEEELTSYIDGIESSVLIRTNIQAITNVIKSISNSLSSTCGLVA